MQNNKNNIGSLSIAVFFISLNTLLLEILLIRVFDTILLKNTGYMVITCAMFGLGLAGIITTTFPLAERKSVHVRLAICTLLLALAVFLLRPMVNLAPDIYGGISLPLVKYGLAAVWLYMSIVTPFVFAGLAFSYLFSAFPSRINALYFWDLLGAAVGCVIFLPFIRDLGPGGLMIASSGALVLISALLLGKKSQSIVLVTIGVIVFATPFIKTAEYFDFDMLQDKRGLRTALEEGRVERSVWDPISKIDVVTNRFNKHIAYDGGSQSSNIFSFDGDYEGLRESILQGGDVKSQFWHHGVLASHYFRRDSNAEVLIIGSAGGQETKAALMFNPKSVDGILQRRTISRPPGQ
jgi:hypothetical protein